MAYQAQSDKKRFLVVDGREGKRYDDVRGDFVFSPDGKQVAYVVKSAGKWLVVVDEQEGKYYDGIGDDIFFSPDSSRIAYQAQSYMIRFLVVY